MPAPDDVRSTRWRRLLTRFADDRGDVPGWVLVAVMTAGLVTTLWVVAGPELTSLFTHSLSSVTGK